jgi:nitrile hydratase accessory protein
MYTSFEQFAAASMLGQKEAPPRSNGELLFQRAWEGRAFGMAIALSKKGHYEWEDFRRELISSIAEWEDQHGNDGLEWDYYQRWLLALERLLKEAYLLNYQELESRTKELLACEQGAA